MSKMILPDAVVDLPVHATGRPTTWGAVFNQRLSTDPYFYATVTLQNVTNGSRYRLSMHNSPFTELVAGLQSGSNDIVLANIPTYESPMVMDVLVRNFNGTTMFYQQYTTQAVLVKTGTIVYVVQTEDPTA
jgi:hypothetical protein